MNFIAHLVLSPKEPGYIAGNLAADFLNGPDRKDLSESVLRGISMHQFVDQFTDTHQIVKISQNRVKGDFRLLSGILIDVFYDHFLARNFEDIANTSLQEFCAYIYEALAEQMEELPPRLKRFAPFMINENILYSYHDIIGIRVALLRINKRLRHAAKIDTGLAIAALRSNYELLESDFKAFFSELIKETASYRKGYDTFLLTT